MALEQETTEPGLITSTAYSSVAGISVHAARTTQGTHWDPPQINWSSQIEPPPHLPLFLIIQLSLKLNVSMSYPETCVEACEL